MNKIKRDRVYLYFTELEQVLKTANETNLKITEKYKIVAKKDGYKEEEEFWRQLAHKANAVVSQLDEKFGKAQDFVKKLKKNMAPQQQLLHLQEKVISPKEELLKE